eukprot:scaffold89278_cov33-Cyclotella_meneghiniana.AAC.3
MAPNTMVISVKKIGVYLDETPSVLSQHYEVFSQSERASVPRHAINQTDIDASVRIHKNTHVSVQRSHDRPSFTVFDAVGRLRHFTT